MNLQTENLKTVTKLRLLEEKLKDLDKFSANKGSRFY